MRGHRLIFLSGIVISFIGFVHLVHGQRNVWWPIPENYGITSGFAEFRPFRFHFGVDFSTNGRLRLPVRVWNDGEIYRIRVERRGYGNAVYVRHPDGLITLYAHLDGFEHSNTGLAQYVSEVRKKTGQWYPGDIHLEQPIPVKAGMVIGYSGESGAGPPHLHVEFRDGENRPVNPLGVILGDAGDRQRPVIQGLIWVPADKRTVIQGSPGPFYIPVRSAERWVRRTEPLVLTGPVDLFLSIYDPTFRPYRRVPAEITLSIDGALLYHWKPRYLTFSDMPRAGFVYDFGRRAPEGWTIPLRITRSYHAPEGVLIRGIKGPLRLKPGHHQMEILVRDYQGATQKMTLPVVQTEGPDYRVERFENELVLISEDKHHRPWWVEIRLPGSPWRRIEPDEDRKVKVQWDPEQCPSIRVVTALNEPVILRQKISLSCEMEPPSEVVFDAFGLFMAKPGQWAPCQQPERCSTFFPYETTESLSSEKFPGVKTYFLVPGKRYRLDLGNFQWDVPDDALFHPLNVYVSRQDPMDVPPGLKPVSPMLRMESTGWAFARPFRIRWQSAKRGTTSGIFWYHPLKKTWVFGGEFPDYPHQIVSYHPLWVMMAEDHAPPAFTSPDNVVWNPDREPLRIHYREIGFGLRLDRIRASWDGKALRIPQEVDEDPDYPAIVFRPHSRPASGEHRFSVTLEDWAGHRVEKTFTVIVR